jgi:hypothetical protein
MLKAVGKSMTTLLVNDTVERLCRLGAESIQRYAQVSRRDVRYNMLECFTQSYILANFDRGATAKIDMEVGIRDLTTTFPGAETMARFPRFELVFYNEDKPYAVVELKSGGIENNDRIRLREVLPYIVNKPAGIVASYMKAADAQRFQKEMEEQRTDERDIWFKFEFMASNRPFVFAAHAFYEPVKAAAPA